MAFKTFVNTTAIVTDGAHGIDRTIAIELASRGAKVLITYTRAQAQVLETWTVFGAPTAIVEAAPEKRHKIDIFVNNAATEEDYILFETTEANFETGVTTNICFALLLINSNV
ncbi:hypothetical protein DE146DRAFT_759859 [Phaeosphaeria sp. MPI-PUGE-AT-0046c]|nr:hypothetical protein DE146DRAFT_759859 [Phaeosphaeria sp. MPI-PUGE-AT-0046c]